MAPQHIVGIDWSGDPGDPRRAGATRWIVFAAAQSRLSDLELLEHRLRALRGTFRLPEHFAFKYHRTRPSIRTSFFTALEDADIAIYVLVVDKLNWGSTWVSRTNGNERIASAISTLMCLCPSEVVSGQRVTIDLPASEGRFVRQIRNRVRDDFLMLNRAPIDSWKPVPDHRPDGLLIQIADMTAGYIHDACLGQQVEISLGLRRKIQQFAE